MIEKTVDMSIRTDSLLTTENDCYYIGIICMTIIIVAIITAYVIVRLSKSKQDADSMPSSDTQEIKPMPVQEQLALEQERHTNKLKETCTCAEEERKSLEKEHELIVKIMHEAAEAHTLGLNVSIEQKIRGNNIKISTFPSDIKTV